MTSFDDEEYPRDPAAVLERFDVCEYLSKWGFGDGDDRPCRALAKQWSHRVVHGLNEELEGLGSWKFDIMFEGKTSHNELWAVLVNGTGPDAEWKDVTHFRGQDREKVRAAVERVRSRIHFLLKKPLDAGIAWDRSGLFPVKWCWGSYRARGVMDDVPA